MMNKVIFVASLLSVFCGAEGFLMPEISNISKKHVTKKRTCRATRCKFTQEEDRNLIALVNEFGDKHWNIIADNMPGRNARQVRERWTRYLSPNIDHREFTEVEDILLRQKVIEFGAQWTKIVKYFPNRTPHAIKNRWNVLRRRREVAEITFENDRVAYEMAMKNTTTNCVDASSVQLKNEEESVLVDVSCVQPKNERDIVSIDDMEVDSMISKYFNSSSDFDDIQPWPSL